MLLKNLGTTSLLSAGVECALVHLGSKGNAAALDFGCYVDCEEFSFWGPHACWILLVHIDCLGT